MNGLFFHTIQFLGSLWPIKCVYTSFFAEMASRQTNLVSILSMVILKSLHVSGEW